MCLMQFSDFYRYDLLLPMFQNGWTPIMQASQDGDVEMVKILAHEDTLEINHASKVQ